MEQNNTTESLKNTKLRIWLILFGGLVLTLIHLSFPRIIILETNLSPFLFTIGKTFMAASIIGLILRVPALLNDVNNSSIKLFKDNDFLNRLDVKELQTLRSDATESAYLKSANRVNTSLKEIDTEIANLFLSPYFSSYKIVVRCKLLENNIIEKFITTTFTLNNPSMEKCNATDYFRSRVILKREDDLKNEDMRKITKFHTIIDKKGNWEDKIESVEMLYEDYFEESSPYNLLSHIKFKDGNLFEFDENIQFRITEKRTVSIQDNTFIHRVISPVEKFHVNYSFEKCEVDLIGNCFGTFQDTKNGGINIVKDSNSIDITTEKWLLNGNGIIIVHNFNK